MPMQRLGYSSLYGLVREQPNYSATAFHMKENGARISQEGCYTNDVIASELNLYLPMKPT